MVASNGADQLLPQVAELPEGSRDGSYATALTETTWVLPPNWLFLLNRDLEYSACCLNGRPWLDANE